MHVEYTGRHAEISAEFRRQAEKKLAKLAKVLDRVTDVNVTLTVEKGRRSVEVSVQSPSLSLNAVEEGHDDITVLGTVMDRLIKQAQRRLGKLRERKRTPARATALWEGIMSPWPTTPPGAGPEGLRPAPNGPGDGIVAAAVHAKDVPPTEPHVVRSRRFVVRTMSVADAAREVARADEGFLVFREEKSQKTNVIFRRRDGSLGLIEPEA